MRRIVAAVLAFAAAVCLGTGCEKQASSIVLPSAETVAHIAITGMDGTERSYTDPVWIEQFLAVLAQTEATGRESVQDAPDTVPYGRVELAADGGVTVLFYYAEDGAFYVEQPYAGIYKTDVDLEALAAGAA